MKYQGSCHCGQIKIEVEGDIGQVIDCNCSFCQRRGALLWFVPRTQLNLASQPAELPTYRFNTHKLAHHFCRNCGIAPFSEGTSPDGKAMAAVNVRCLEGVEPAKLKIVPFDGRSK
jgi:hypothetical protein